MATITLDQVRQAVTDKVSQFTEDKLDAYLERQCSFKADEISTLFPTQQEKIDAVVAAVMSSATNIRHLGILCPSDLDLSADAAAEKDDLDLPEDLKAEVALVEQGDIETEQQIRAAMSSPAASGIFSGGTVPDPDDDDTHSSGDSDDASSDPMGTGSSDPKPPKNPPPPPPPSSVPRRPTFKRPPA